jgi:hypothetical protein
VPTLGQAGFRLLLALLCLAPTSCDFGEDEAKDSSPTQSEGAPEHVEIQSSLDGFSILPRRIAWTATTSLPLGEVREVRFRLDGEGLWSDPTPPFAYGEEGAQLGTWMGPGRHRFTVRVIATDGSRANETVIVRVRKTKTNDKVMERLGPAVEGRARNADPSRQDAQAHGPCLFRGQNRVGRPLAGSGLRLRVLGQRAHAAPGDGLL